MKKILIILGILSLICINCAFADTETVYGTIENAVNTSVLSMSHFRMIQDEIIDYIEGGNIPGLDLTSDRYIVFPASVLNYSDTYGTYHFIFYLNYVSSSASGTWGVITHNINDNYYFVDNNANKLSNNLCVGGTLNSGTSYLIEYTYDVDSSTYNPAVITNRLYTQTGNLDKSYVWCLQYYNSLEDTVYLVADTKAGAFNRYGVWGSIYASNEYDSISFIPCYDELYAGWDTGNWDRRYTINPDNQVIDIYPRILENNSQTISEITVTDNTITVTGSPFSGSILSNLDNIWESLKNTVINLLGLLGSLGSIFGLIFSWLPPEVSGLVSTLLIFCAIYLVIKALRGG